MYGTFGAWGLVLERPGNLTLNILSGHMCPDKYSPTKASFLNSLFRAWKLANKTFWYRLTQRVFLEYQRLGRICADFKEIIEVFLALPRCKNL